METVSRLSSGGATPSAQRALSSAEGSKREIRHESQTTVQPQRLDPEPQFRCPQAGCSALKMASAGLTSWAPGSVCLLGQHLCLFVSSTSLHEKRHTLSLSKSQQGPILAVDIRLHFLVPSHSLRKSYRHIVKYLQRTEVCKAAEIKSPVITCD